MPVAATMGALTTICEDSGTPLVVVVVVACTASATNGFTPTGVATAPPLTTFTAIACVTVALAPLLASSLVARNCSCRVPVKPDGGFTPSLLQSQPVRSSAGFAALT